jgi:serine phosphatase RsbU (regulator of sigma subunit)
MTPDPEKNGGLISPLITTVNKQVPARILVVDDDKFIRQIMERYLTREGFELQIATDGRKAMDILESYRPDIVISDWMMPEFDGIDLCRWIRQNDEIKDIYFILLTAKDRVEDKTLGLTTGADDYVTKPFQGAELIARVRSGLRLREIQKELSKAYKLLDNEFQVLADLQKSLLPQAIPEIGAFEFASHYSPSLLAGGDYYDFIKVTNIHMGILVADVSGHGAAASMIMAIMRVVMRAFVQELLSPAGALSVVNNVLVEHVPTDQFATAFYGILNLRSHRFVYSSAGHNPPLFYRAAEGRAREIKNSGGVPLKILRDIRYEEAEITFEPGDQLLLYTDGLTEAFDPDREMFGEEALANLISRYGVFEPKVLVEEIWRSLHAFVRAEPFHDDVTLVSIRRKPE